MAVIMSFLRTQVSWSSTYLWAWSNTSFATISRNKLRFWDENWFLLFANTFWYNIETNITSSFFNYNNGLYLSAGAWVIVTDSTFGYNWSTNTNWFFAGIATVAWFSVARTAGIYFFTDTEWYWETAFVTLFAWLNWWAGASSSFMWAFFTNPRFGWFAWNNDFNFFNTYALWFETYLAWGYNNFFGACTWGFGL